MLLRTYFCTDEVITAAASSLNTEVLIMVVDPFTLKTTELDLSSRMKDWYASHADEISVIDDKQDMKEATDTLVNMLKHYRKVKEASKISLMFTFVKTDTGYLEGVDVNDEEALRQFAIQYIKAHPELTGLSYDEFAEKDIHVHVPEGAVPKDGPSAGITMVSSMVSAYRGKKVKSGIAMTGEMTLRGRVLPVGGIKEKILAAKRSGIHTIVISEENRKDVEDIKEIYIKGLTFVYVKDIKDVIDFIF